MAIHFERVTSDTDRPQPVDLLIRADNLPETIGVGTYQPDTAASSIQQAANHFKYCGRVLVAAALVDAAANGEPMLAHTDEDIRLLLADPDAVYAPVTGTYMTFDRVPEIIQSGLHFIGQEELTDPDAARPYIALAGSRLAALGHTLKQFDERFGSGPQDPPFPYDLTVPNDEQPVTWYDWHSNPQSCDAIGMHIDQSQTAAGLTTRAAFRVALPDLSRSEHVMIDVNSPPTEPGATLAMRYRWKRDAADDGLSRSHLPLAVLSSSNQLESLMVAMHAMAHRGQPPQA